MGKIFKISIALDKSGIHETLNEYDCEKNKLGYLVTTSAAVPTRKRLVKNKDVMRIDSKLNDIVTTIHRFTWYLKKSDEQKARELCTSAVKEQAQFNFKSAKVLMSHIQ